MPAATIRSMSRFGPTGFSEFIGQAQARANLEVFISAAKQRKAALDHVLFVGPPGLGKTTLAQIVARELGVGFRATSGPVIAKAGDLAALLTNLEERDVLFIDEIHRLNPAIEEILYPAMEDYQLDLIIGEGPAARSVRIDLAQVHADRRDHARRAAAPRRCATASAFRCGSISTRPKNWCRSSSAARGCSASAWHPTGRWKSRAARAARRASPAGCCAGSPISRWSTAPSRSRAPSPTRRCSGSMSMRAASTQLDRRYLTTIAEFYTGGPVGIETIAAALSEPRDALEEIVEPYLIQQGFIQRTPRGRMLTALAFQHLGTACRRASWACRRACSRSRTGVKATHRFEVRVYYEDTDFSGQRLSRGVSPLLRARAHRVPARRWRASSPS